MELAVVVHFSITTAMGFFRCRDGNGQMVRLAELCDGNATCDDGFDEINPLCAGT